MALPFSVTAAAMVPHARTSECRAAPVPHTSPAVHRPVGQGDREDYVKGIGESTTGAGEVKNCGSIRSPVRGVTESSPAIRATATCGRDSICARHGRTWAGDRALDPPKQPRRSALVCLLPARETSLRLLRRTRPHPPVVTAARSGSPHPGVRVLGVVQRHLAAPRRRATASEVAYVIPRQGVPFSGGRARGSKGIRCGVSADGPRITADTIRT